MICQIKPRIKCSRPSFRSDAPMLTVERPSDFADVMTRLLFSVIWKLFRVAFDLADGITEGALDFDEALFRTRSSIVSGTESLINFARRRPSGGWRVISHHSPGRVRSTATHLGIRQRSGMCRSGSAAGRQCLHRQQAPVSSVKDKSISLIPGAIGDSLGAHLVDVPGELGPLVLVDRVGNVRVAALDQDFATPVLVAASGLMVQLRDARSSSRSDSSTGSTSRAHQATESAASEDFTGLGVGAGPELVDEVDKVVEFDLAGRVDRDGLEGLADLVVGPFAGRGFGFRVGREGGQDGRFRQPTCRVEVDLAEGGNRTLWSVSRFSKSHRCSRVWMMPESTSAGSSTASAHPCTGPSVVGARATESVDGNHGDSEPSAGL